MELVNVMKVFLMREQLRVVNVALNAKAVYIKQTIVSLVQEIEKILQIAMYARMENMMVVKNNAPIVQ
jgi:hypothetical protein